MLVLSGKRPNGYFNGNQLFVAIVKFTHASVMMGQDANQLCFSSIFLNWHLKTATTRE